MNEQEQQNLQVENAKLKQHKDMLLDEMVRLNNTIGNMEQSLSQMQQALQYFQEENAKLQRQIEDEKKNVSYDE
ncbi:MAG TPA: hypothetical protein DCW90_09610, partial [Lachnospiraceae bacterium]|nr:hypothetical protein [Lachnospiraceae bacterium]